MPILTSFPAVISAGLFSLLIALGVGRFAYTALLPGMQETFLFSDTVAGTIASINNVGYLAGTLLCQKKVSPKLRLFIFRAALIVSVTSTFAMGLTTQLIIWEALRLAGGIASGVIFVLASALVVETLKEHQLPYATLIYCGVGTGIAFSGALTPSLVKHVGVLGAWMGIAAVCIPMAIWCYLVLNKNTEPNHKAAETTAVHETRPDEQSAILPWFLAAYFLEGFGYISSATFIVAFLKNSTPVTMSTMPWIITGLSAALSIPLITIYLRRFSTINILIVMYALQCIGIMLPVLYQTSTGAIVGSILFGGTFMGIAAQSIYLGTQLYPGQKQWIIGMLASFYAFGQILGPTISGVIADYAGGFVPALTFSAAIVALGGLFMFIGAMKIKPQGIKNP